MQAKIAETRAKLQAEIDKLSGYKEFEGKTASWDVYGDGSLKVTVNVNGYARKAFKRELFSVTPIMGSGSVNVSVDKLTFEETSPAAAPEATSAPAA